MNIAQNVERARRYFPDRTAILFEGEELSFLELDRRANQVANTLRELGVERGDRVALFLPNIPAFTYCYLGVQKIGAVAVSLNVMLRPPEVKYIVEDARAQTLITTAELRTNVPKDELEEGLRILIAEGEAGEDASLATLMEQASGEARALELGRDDAAAILYTSGTTGFPKGATLSHGNVISNIYATNHCTRMVPEDRVLLFLPLFHCFGQNFIMNAAINSCSSLLMQRRFVPEDAVRALSSEGVTMFLAVPTIFIGLLNAEIPAKAFASTRFHFSAAAPLPAEIAERWCEAYGHKVYEGYGLTETSPFASYNHELRHKTGSIGTPIENVEMKIVDDDGAEVEPGVWGEIVIKGPNVMLGYWGREEATEKAIVDGWFHSGDIGTNDEEGYFFICDRVDDMVITSGFNVYPAEVENVIHGHPSVAEVAVYGEADELKGEVVKASVVAKPGEEPTTEALDAFCRDKLASYKVPRLWEFVDTIPKGATGKVLKRELRSK